MKKSFLTLTLILTVLMSMTLMAPASAASTDVAAIGDAKFATLQGAIDAAQPGDTITLLGDVEMDETLTVPTGKTVTLDLNGKTVSFESTVQDEAMITNKGTLTINDSVGTGVINYNYVGAADSSYGKGNYTISNAGTLTVNGGKITIANLSAHAKYPIDNNSGTGNAVLVINGGHLYNYNTSAIRLFCNSTTYQNSVTINGGMIEGYSAIWVQNPGSKTVHGALAITGGEIKTTAKAYVNGTAELKDVSSGIYCTISGNGGAWSKGSSISITGGIFNENVELAENAPATTVVEGSGGATFNGRLELPAPEPPVVIPDDIVDTIVGTEATEQEKQVVQDIVDEIEANTALSDESYKPVDEIADVEELVVTLSDIDLTESVPTVLTYIVEPKDAEGNKVSNPSSPITFRLPIPASVTEPSAKVSHNGTLIAIYAIQGTGNAKYVEVTSDSFSPYTVEPTNEAPTTYVAQIGSEKYATLTAAVAAAQNGDEIDLLADVTLSEALIATGKIIDLNGKSLTGNVIGTLKMSGGKFVTPEGYNQIVPEAEEYGVKDIYVSNDAVVKMEMLNQTDMKLTMVFGTVTLAQSWYTLDNQSLVIEDGAKFVIPANMFFYVKNGTSAVVEEGGNLVVNGVVKMEAGATLTAPEGLNVVAVADGYKVVYENGSYSVEEVAYVAQIGSEKYETLAAAVAAAQNGDEIDLLANITETVEISKALTINLNGKTINGVTAATGYEIVKTGTTWTVQEKVITPPTPSNPPVVIPSYRITVAETENGSVSLSRTSASKDALVTITANPDAGKKVLKVTVAQQSNGAEIAVTAESATKYTFRMPKGAVTVTVTFECNGTTSSCATHHLTDVDQDQWYHIAVDYAVSNGLMKGIGETTFAPDATMERSMVIQVLYNMEKTPAVTATGKFTDAPVGQWYTNAIEWGVANKLVSGYGDIFKPNGNITREEIATMLYNYAKFKGMDVSARGDLSKFSDGDATSAWAKEIMQWAVGSGLMSGGGGKLNPTGNATRAEVAQMFKNFNEIFGF